jgi:hypothetical protein
MCFQQELGISGQANCAMGQLFLGFFSNHEKINKNPFIFEGLKTSQKTINEMYNLNNYYYV